MKKSKFLQSSKDMLHRSFKPEKCKTSLRLVTSRMKLLRNKKEVAIRQMRREVAQLLESGQDQTARIRVEHVIREEKMMSAFELISLYSELIMSRMPIIESQKNCPIDLKEAITSLVFASPRCSDVPELLDVQKQFSTKYGKDFINAAIELRPNCGVSRMLVEKLSAKAPDGQTKLKILTAIAEEHSIKWDPKSFGENDLTTSNDLLSGPPSLGAENLQTELPRHQPSNNQTPQSQIHNQPLEPQQNVRFSQGTQHFNYTSTDGGGGTVSSPSQPELRHSGIQPEKKVGKQSYSGEGNSFSLGMQRRNMEFKDAASAAQAAAESAEQASMAARAAAALASRDSISKPYITESHKSGVHVQREGEGYSKDLTNSSNFERHPNSRGEHVQGTEYNDLRDGNRRFNQDGYDSTNRYSQSSSSKSKASLDGNLFPHGTGTADECSQESFSKEGNNKPEVITKKQFDKSEYESDAQDGSRRENFHYMREEYTEKDNDRGDIHDDASSRMDKSEYESDAQDDSRHENFHYMREEYTEKDSDRGHNHGYASSHLHSSFYDKEKDASDFTRQSFESPHVADHYHGSEQEQNHGDTSQTGAGGPASADESGSEDDKILFDTGPKYDEPDSDLDFHSPGTKSPSNIFLNQDAQDFRFEQSRSQETFVLIGESSMEKLASPPVDDIKFDDSVPMKFDDSDGSNPESEDSMDESGNGRKNYSLELPAKKNQNNVPSRSSFNEQGNSSSDQKLHLHTSPDEPESTEVRKANSRRTGFSSDSSENSDSPLSPAGQPSQRFSRSQLDLKNRESSQSTHSMVPEHEDNDRSVKSSQKLVNDEKLTQTSSELNSQLNFGKLTGGLKHKPYNLPPYTRNQFSNVSSSVNKSAEGNSSVILESSSASADHMSQSTRVTLHEENKTSLRRPNPLSDSDTDSSEDELPLKTSIPRREPYYQLAAKETQTKSKPKGSVTFFESDSEDDFPKKPFSGKNHSGSGFSQRTKPTSSSSGIPKVKPAREEFKSSYSGAERKPDSSSYNTQSAERPQSQRKGSFWLGNSEESSSTKGTSEKMPESQMPFYQEREKSAAVDQPSIRQQEEVPIGTIKSSQESASKVGASNRENSVKKASHVHPKLPDYDSLAARLESLRKNS